MDEYEKLHKKNQAKATLSKTEAHSTLAINRCLETFNCIHLQWFYEKKKNQTKTRSLYFTVNYFIDLYRVKLGWKYELSVASFDLQKKFKNFGNAGEIRTAKSGLQFLEWSVHLISFWIQLF